LPHIYASKLTKSPNLPYKDGDFEITLRACNDRFSMYFVTYKTTSFLLTLKEKNGMFLIKYEKSTRPAEQTVLVRAIEGLANALGAEVYASNLADKKNLKTSELQLSPDFFYQNKDFLSGKIAELEIGFGSGRHMLSLAKQSPEKVFFGVEVYKAAVLQLLKRVELEDVHNIFVVDFDARLFLQTLPPASLDKVYVHFPVPWNDAPHRRVISKRFLDDAFRAIKEGGSVQLRTDDEQYFNDALALSLEYTNAKICVHKNRELAVSSKYEDRWKKQGKDIYDLSIYNLQGEGNANLEYNFALNSALIDRTKVKDLIKKAFVFDGYFVKFDDWYESDDDKTCVFKVAFGCVDAPERRYLVVESEKAYFYPSQPLVLEKTVAAFEKLKELVYGKNY
jgi:tRNA (guanine-N7-)-methyltransferase